MKLEFLKSVMDSRGRIMFCKYGDLSINIVETKKGFSRGGHFHEFHTCEKYRISPNQYD